MNKKEFQETCNLNEECNNVVNLKCLRLNDNNATVCICEELYDWNGQKCGKFLK